MWKCSACGEQIEEAFEVCWNCQAPREGEPQGGPADEPQSAQVSTEPEGPTYVPVSSRCSLTTIAEAGSEAGERAPVAGFPFNWGAFLLGPIWLVGNGKLVAGLALFVANVAASAFRLSRGGFEGWLPGVFLLFVNLYYGFAGTQLVWERGGYSSAERLIRLQQVWGLIAAALLSAVAFVIHPALGIAGIGLLIISVIGAVKRWRTDAPQGDRMRPDQDRQYQVRACPSCAAEYRLADYRADAGRIYCSNCKTELPRA